MLSDLTKVSVTEQVAEPIRCYPSVKPHHCSWWADLCFDPVLQVHSIITSPARRCLSTAQLISQLQVEVSRQGAAVPAASDASKPPRVLVLPELRNLDVGMWEGQPTKLVRHFRHDDAHRQS